MLDRIDKLIKKNDMTASQLTTDLNISSSTLTDWGKGKGVPKAITTIIKIAEYFNVTTDWILLGKESISASDDLYYLSSKEKQIIDTYRSFNKEGHERFINNIDDMERSGKYIKTDKLKLAKTE